MSLKRLLLAGAVACGLCISDGMAEPHVSMRFGRIIERHAEEILGQGYALGISPTDFDHGHVLLNRKFKNHYDSLDDFVPSIRLVLYHTDELPIERHSPQDHRKKPRSIIGMMNGRVVPAADLIDVNKLSSQLTYKNHGTVFPGEFAAQYPDLQYLGPKKEYPMLRYVGRLNYIVDLVPDPAGCFEAAGIKFDIFFEYDSEKGAGFLYKKLVTCNTK